MKCENVKECSCPKTTCPNWGCCCACVTKHRATDSLPFCLFEDNNGDKSNRNHYEMLKKRFDKKTGDSMEKQEWLLKIKEWLTTDHDDGECDSVTLDIPEELTYHEVWRVIEQCGFIQEDLEIGKEDAVEGITFIKRPGDKFQLVLERDDDESYSWLAKYYA